MPVRDLLSAASGTGAPADPYFYDVSLLLNGDGTNGAQNNTFLDSSTNNFTITRNGNTTQGSFSPYGTLWSNYFDGSTGNYLVTPSSGLPTASGDFTVSCWFNLQSFANAYYCVGGNWTSGTSGQWLIQIANDGSIRFLTAAGTSFSSAGVVALNTWNYFSASRSGTTVTVSLNGSTLYTYTKSDTLGNTTDPIYIGSQPTGSTWNFNGYISNLRFVTSAQSAAIPTSPATAISGTSFLTCQSNRFKDNSSNNYALTVGGTPSVQRFSPFNPTAPYSTSVIGGSGYFDGSGDYLSLGSTSAFGFGNTFTIEAWVYLTANPSGTTAAYLTDFRGSSTNNYTLGVIGSGGVSKMYSYCAGSGLNETGSTTITLNTWHHVAYVNNGGTFTMYLDGVSQSSTSSSYSQGSSSLVIAARYNGAQEFINGYISDVRINNTQALYTTTFTPNTSPLTTSSQSSTSTQLLTSMTNAGIPDLAMQNNLETAGSAQVSTSVKKYGTGSLSFSGGNSYLVSPSSPVASLANGDFTVEFWLYATSPAANQRLVQSTNGGFGSTDWIIRLNTSAQIEVAVAYPDVLMNSTTTISANTWYYITLTRSGSSVKLWINGTNEATGTSSSNLSSSVFYVGGYYTSGNTEYFTGYMDDLRITKGLARYTTTFTPPTAALPTY